MFSKDNKVYKFKSKDNKECVYTGFKRWSAYTTRVLVYVNFLFKDNPSNGQYKLRSFRLRYVSINSSIFHGNRNVFNIVKHTNGVSFNRFSMNLFEFFGKKYDV